MKAVDLDQSEHEKLHKNLRDRQSDYNPLRGRNIYTKFHDNSSSNVKIGYIVWEPQMTVRHV